MKFFCKTDNKFICQVCLLKEDHLQKGHEICGAEEIIDKNVLICELKQLQDKVAIEK